MNQPLRPYGLIILLLTCVVTFAKAQQNPQDTIGKQKIDVDHADLFEYQQKDTTIIQKLNGNVELRQDSVFMYCDTAIIINSIDLTAQGNVIIQQGDSVNIFSDSLVYNGDTKIADLFGDVILVNGNQRLFTNKLRYDLNTKIATYQEGATLTNDSTQLTSKRGYYYVDQQAAFFKDSVVVVDPQFSLRSDTLEFDVESKTVFFLGPTLISSDSSKIYCEAGFYDTENKLAEFQENAQYVKGEQIAEAEIIRYDGSSNIYTLEGNARFEENDRKAFADSIEYDEKNDKTTLIGNASYKDEQQNIKADEIVYDAKKEIYSTRGRSVISDPPQILEADQVDYSEEKGLGIAIGNVVWRDTSANLTIRCGTADYNRKTNYLKASGGERGRPLLISEVDEDFLFMAADTLLSIKEDSLAADSVRVLLAYNDVRVFKSNLQAIADSLSYASADSIFRFFYNPIVWSDTSQFYADTIDMEMTQEKLNKINLLNDAFIINSPDEVFFNQVKGKNIYASFQDNELRKMDVQGNAESVYYAIDEKGAYVGVNETICSDMILLFGNNQGEQIKFLAQPQATMHPMKQVDHEVLKIKGFNWEIKLRPMNIDALFEERPKRSRKRMKAMPGKGRKSKRPANSRNTRKREESKQKKK